MDLEIKLHLCSLLVCKPTVVLVLKKLLTRPSPYPLPQAVAHQVTFPGSGIGQLGGALDAVSGPGEMGLQGAQHKHGPQWLSVLLFASQQ